MIGTVTGFSQIYQLLAVELHCLIVQCSFFSMSEVSVFWALAPLYELEEYAINDFVMRKSMGRAKGDYKSTESFCREMIKENEKELGVDHELILIN